MSDCNTQAMRPKEPPKTCGTCDSRSGVRETLCDGRALEVDPDVVLDVTDLPFDDGTFPLVVFDPPHLHAGATGWSAPPCAPLFGNRRPGSSKTHWLVFFKGGCDD